MDALYVFRQISKASMEFDKFFGKSKWALYMSGFMAERIEEVSEPYTEEELDHMADKYIDYDANEPFVEHTKISAKTFIAKIPDPRVRKFLTE